MELTEKQIELLSRRNLVVLATASLKGDPRAIIVEVNKAGGDKLIITDNEMGATKDNFLANNKVFVLAFEADYSYCLKIIGVAKHYQGGEHFDFVKNLETNKKQNPKGAVVVNIKQIIEFQ
jgi:predicted pyridoxine 5'-phosphate oxidase superfamily flavin-nucleotide-binding protein